MPATTRSPKRTKTPKYEQDYIRRATLACADNIAATIARELGRPIEEILQWPEARKMYLRAGVHDPVGRARGRAPRAK